ncbi:hypothetical protein OK015_17175 [Mycobacterium sp. Aquia_216]|uniref:DUF7373 family lipoprotein n=1 Tax=Mycobacterium sp. Aquia_216 TaxID=2991729 RepID=UPI00227CFA1B|nr:hypothetical protein [Mycobacterium sp. Aquia_216]WAJ42979.1 hypothetical protein OK015_17175 [Mycobacterium sp. Aquia_216]
MGGIDSGALVTGNFPTVAQPPFGRAGTVHAGVLLEARRLASNVVPPFQVDPSLSDRTTTLANPLQSADAVSLALPEPIPGGAANHNFITGFATARRAMTKELINVVLRFGAPEDAMAAATDMSAKSASIQTRYSGSQSTHPIPIPRHSGTAAFMYEVPSQVNVFAYTAHGPYVLCQHASGTEGADALINMVATTLDLQGPLIDQFSPTPVEQLPELQIDPSGLWASTLSAEETPTVDEGVYDARAILHFQENPPRSKQLFDSVGLQYGSISRDNVYQMPDAAAAARAMDGLVADAEAHGTGAAGVRGLPAARCFKLKDAASQNFYCLAQADRYAIEASDSDPEVREKVAAQYLVLTEK